MEVSRWAKSPLAYQNSGLGLLELHDILPPIVTMLRLVFASCWMPAVVIRAWRDCRHGVGPKHSFMIVVPAMGEGKGERGKGEEGMSGSPTSA